MNQPEDNFLHALFEEPRPEFVETLWLELSNPKEAMMESGTRSDGYGHLTLPSVQQIKRRDSYHRVSWVAALFVLICGVVLAAALLFHLKSGREGIHLANLNAAITPTVSPEVEETPTPWSAVDEQQSINLALMPSERKPPDTTVILRNSSVGMEFFALTNGAPAVRLLSLSSEDYEQKLITIELVADVPQPGVILRVSRYTDSEIQPLLIYKPQLLGRMRLELPVASSDENGWADELIVELMTPLPEGEGLALRAYQGTMESQSIARTDLGCENFPQYCVPLAGGGTGDFAAFESADTRTLTAPSSGVSGVVRGFNPITGAPFLGDPLAPVRVAVFLDFPCAQCPDYFLNDLQRFIRDYVLTGRATLELYLLTGTRGPISELAAQAALAAGEQGAFWEMVHELSYVRVLPMFTISDVEAMALRLGLNADELVETVESGRYEPLLESQSARVQEYQITGVPTVMVNLRYSRGWIVVDRRYESLSQWVEQVPVVGVPQGMVAVKLPLDPETVDQVAFGLQEGDQVTITLSLQNLEPEMREVLGITDPDTLYLPFENLRIIAIGFLDFSDSDVLAVLAVTLAVAPDDGLMISNLIDAGATFSVELQ